MFFKIFMSFIVAIILALWLDIKETENQFNDDVNNTIRVFNQRIASIDSLLTSYVTLLDVSEDINETELMAYTKKIKKAYPYINGMINMQRINQNDIAMFEQSMTKKGYINLKIKPLTTLNDKRNIKYFPVNSIEPMTPVHAQMLGLNLYSRDYYLAEIDLAIRDGGIVSSKIENRSTPEFPEILLFKALYSGRYAPKDEFSRIKSVNGVVALEINIFELMSFTSSDDFNLESHLNNVVGDEKTPILNQLSWSLGQIDYVKKISIFQQTYYLYLTRQFDLAFIDKPRMGIIWFVVLFLMFFISFLWDKRQFAEKALITSEKRFTRIAQATPIGIFQADINGHCIFINDGYKKIAKIEEKDALGDGWSNYIYSEDKQNVFETWALSVKKNESFNMDYRHLLPDESFIWVHCESVAEYDDDGEIISYLGTIQDITKQKEAVSKIAYQAHFDSLTRLPNRFLTLDRLSHLLKDAQRHDDKVGLLFIDLDDFKKVNDSLGHEVGDCLLTMVASRLEEVIRSADTVGRIGGDEFLMMIAGLSDLREVTIISEKVIETFKQPYIIKGRELFITVSIGIALYPQDGQNSSELLANADLALYQAKDLGRNTFSFYTEQLNKENSRRLLIEENLHGALSRNEFSVVYQPKINMDNGAIMGAEALLRWSNSAIGTISPNEFIPIAEQIDLIHELGEFVLKQALKETTWWQKIFDPKFKIAVNLSPKQFRDRRLFGLVENALKVSNVSPDCLELEITEGLLLNKYEGIKETLNCFSDLGIQIAMDDFGTGYSSLSYLRSYPFNVLKIDRSFVSEMNEDASNCELVYATIAMSHGLNLKVVAEGVETESQYKLLKQHHCDFAQGYLFSKPISATEMSKLLEQKKKYSFN